MAKKRNRKTTTQRAAQPKWAAYEAVVAAIHRDFGESAVITEGEKILGKSGIIRKCDITIRTTVCGYPILIVIECKDYKRPVEVSKVESLISFIADVRASKGIIISDSGFTEGALARAKESGLIELCAVFDATNGNLKARLFLPMVCEWLNLHFRTQLKWQSRLHMRPDQDLQNRAHNRFADLWNSGQLRREQGHHTHTEVLLETPRIEAVYEYEVISRLFLKEIGLEEGSGTYNFGTGGVTTKGFTLEPIVFADVIRNWQPVEEDKVPPHSMWFTFGDSMPKKQP